MALSLQLSLSINKLDCTIIPEIMLLLFSSQKSVYFTLHHVTIDDGCITSYTPCVLEFNYHVHLGSYFDPLTYQDRNYFGLPSSYIEGLVLVV